MWNAVAVFAGMMVGGVVNMVIVSLSGMLFPAPADTDLADPVQLAAWVASLPPQAFVLVLIAHLGQAFAGGAVVAGLARSHVTALALTIGGLSMLGGLMNLLVMPGPAWMWVELPLYFVAAVAGAQLVLRARGPATES